MKARSASRAISSKNSVGEGRESELEEEQEEPGLQITREFIVLKMLPQANASSIVRDNRRTYGYNQANVDQTVEENQEDPSYTMNNSHPQTNGQPEPSTAEVKPAITKKVGRGMSFAPSDRPQMTDAQSVTIDKVPDKLVLHVFSFLRLCELGKVAQVCRKWRGIAYDSRLWTKVSLRPEFSGLHVYSPEVLQALIGIRFGQTLKYIEIPSDLITAPVLHELSNKCPALRSMTLDFSNAMQLHDFNDLTSFPCNLRSLCICLSEVIFLEGFMRRIYSCLSSLDVLHLIGTFELSSESEEDIYEVINISKIKSHTPNLRVVNLYGITFLDDSHIELLASNCIHIEALALNFCLRVKGTSFKNLVQRCKKLKTLLLHHAGVDDQNMMNVPWETSAIHELDLTSTELSAACLENILLRMPGFTYLALGYCEFFNDVILGKLMEQGKFNRLQALDISHTHALSENAIYQFIQNHGHNLQGLMLAGKPKLTENFWLNAIPCIKNVRICVLGTANGWFLKTQSRVHVDQIVEAFAQGCPKMERCEIQWDPDTIRFSDKSNKFIDHIRLKCPMLKSFSLSDGEYYEMVKSNFERADRVKVVRTCTNYTTSIVGLLNNYNDLLFN